MRIVVCFLFVVFTFIEAMAQVVEYNSQNALNSWDQSITVIEQDVVISGPILSLEPLRNVEIIEGSLSIENNGLIQNLEGLHNLKSILGTLKIFNTSTLNIDALSNIQDLEGCLEIDANYHLESLSGLNIHNCLGSLSIGRNRSLIDISALDQLNDIEGFIEIFDNKSLADFDGLQNLTGISGHLKIEQNDLMSDYSFLDNLNSLDGNLEIVNNGNDTIRANLSFENLTSIIGNMILWDVKSIDTLNAFNSLISLEGRLEFYGNTNLNSISSFEKLTSINGELVLQFNDNLKTLSDLSSLKNLSGRLVIHGNDELSTIGEFSSLEEITGDLVIRRNDIVEFIEGFNVMTEASGLILIQENSRLKEISGFDTVSNFSGRFEVVENKNLLSVSGFVDMVELSGSMEFDDNEKLQSLELFTGLNTISGDLRIFDCNQLYEISSLANLSAVTGNLRLQRNENLYNCCALNSVLVSEEFNQIFLNSNSIGCNSYEEILDLNCDQINSLGAKILRGTVLYDESGECTDSSKFLKNQSFTLFDSYGDFKIINPVEKDNNYELNTVPGEYQLKCNVDTSIFLSHPVSQNIIVNYWSDTIDFNFCLNPNNLSQEDVSISIIPPVELRPGFDCNYTLQLNNLGSINSSGVVEVVFDKSVIKILDLNVDFVETESGMEFSYDSLNIFEERYYNLNLIKNSPTDSIPLENGDLICLTAKVHSSNLDINFVNNSSTLCSSITNSFDPNDIECLQGSTIIKKNDSKITLDYRVRFENIGSADAINVKIINDIDTTLFDINSFSLVSSSHSLYSVLEDNQLLFFFNQIGLSNLEGENTGYLVYQLSLKSSVEVNTIIKNEAQIFFDYNFPINTNVFSTTILHDLDQDGFTNLDDCDDQNSNTNPGVIEIAYNGIDDDCDPLTLDDDLDQDGFVLIDDCDDNNSSINPNAIEIIYNGIDDDCNPATLDDDLDQDGYLAEEDCDDVNSNVNPSIEEIPYNGIDDDCDFETLDDDLDQDGFGIDTDCNDNDPNINPDAVEIAGNDIDENCDGAILSSIYDLDGVSIELAPNPVKHSLFIEVNSHNFEYYVELFDQNGKLIKSGESLQVIDIESFVSGLYLIKIQSTTSSKFIVERIVKL